jgi:hypothetical protein
MIGGTSGPWLCVGVAPGAAGSCDNPADEGDLTGVPVLLGADSEGRSGMFALWQASPGLAWHSPRVSPPVWRAGGRRGHPTMVQRTDVEQ